MAMGLIDVLKRLPQILKARHQALKALRDISYCICLDAPDFHLPILHRAKKKGIRSIGIVSPQIWAWRPKRARQIAQKMDQLLCLFDFEPALYPSEFDARFVGHPILQWTQVRSEFVPHRFAFFPGSRPQEIKRNLPIFIQTAYELKKQNPAAQVWLSLPKTISLPEQPDFIQIHHKGAEIARQAQAALSKSGTITLELACMKVPMMVAHQVSPITYFLGKRWITGINHIALPNILSQTEAVPEVIQPKDPKALAEGLLQLPPEQKINLSPITSQNPIQSMLRSIIWETK